MRLAGYAHLAAHNVAHICGEAGDRGCVCLRCPLDGSHQKHLSFVAIIYNCSASQTDGLRPANGTSRKSRRKLPLDLGRFTRIPWVLPVDVPTLVQPEQHPDP